MERFKILSAVLAIAALAAVCAPAKAQTDQNASTPQPVQVVTPAQRPMPFSPGAAHGPVAAIEIRALDQMSRQDRDLAAGAEPAIAERARFAGMDFDQGKWSYRQIVCPALPNHLFLQFTRNSGPGDVSVFSASIPRGGKGQARIIPVLRRGYSPYLSAGANELTIAAFNRIRVDEAAGKDADWLGTGLCYAALAEAHPESGPPEVSATEKPPAAPGLLMIPIEGGAVISFTDAPESPRPMEWTMTFDGKGKLVKATESAAPQSSEKTVELAPVEVKGKLVPEATTDATATVVAAPQEKEKVILLTPVEVQGKPVPATSTDALAAQLATAKSKKKSKPQPPVDLQGKPVPEGPVDLRVKPVTE